MERELVLCIPGPWKDRSDFVRAVVGETKGEFMFAGKILANPGKKEHAPLDFAPHDPEVRRAFEIAGHGKLPNGVLEQITAHRGVAYLHFPIGIIQQKAQVASFSAALRCCGGFALKIESTGVAHEWDRWFAALHSENVFDLYRTFVVLIGDSDCYFSCGMHHFGLPDVEVERSTQINEAADLMNRFNYWQIAEEPKIAAGHTFSVTADSPKYRIALKADSRHDESDLFNNPSGLWTLKRIA